MGSRWVTDSEGRWYGKFYADGQMAERIFSRYNELSDLGHIRIDAYFLAVVRSLGAREVVMRAATSGHVYTFDVEVIRKYGERVEGWWWIHTSFAKEAVTAV